MRIRTRIKIGGALTICILLAYGAVTLRQDRTMSNLVHQIREGNEIVNKITTLRTLTQDFLLYRTERSKTQWSVVYAELIQLLRNPVYGVLMSEYGTGDPLNKLNILGDTFSRLMTIEQPAGPDNPENRARGELQNRLTTQLLLASQDLLTRFLTLNGEINQKLIETQRLSSTMDILALAFLGILLISSMVFLQRSVVKPILKLQDGAGIIGAGNLDHKIGIASRDEVGQLSQAFDRMTANLQEITVSRDELAQEVEERKRAEAALRESEARFRSLFENMTEGVVLHELLYDDQGQAVDYRIVSANASYEKHTGLNPEKIQGQLASIAYGTGAAPYLEEFARVAQTGQAYAFETFFPPMQRYFQISVTSPRRDQFVTVFEDITPRKQAEERLQRTLVDLERSNQDLEEFAYVASHDLQEPLRKMANFSEMLATRYQGQLDDRADKYLGYIADGAKRMKDLINDLLAFSRVGKADFRLTSTDMNDILQGTLNDIQPLVREKQAEITHELLPTLKVNPHQMGQLLQNLIANAIKFHGDQPPRIHISARQEGREWVMAVHDNGIGFEPQYAEGIFKIFRRLHTKEEYPGTGIGLAICKKIMERHGGRIWAETEPGRGATFYFTIPA